MSSDLTFNKIAGGLLATGLAIVGLGELSSIVYKFEPAQKPGYAIQVQEETAGGGGEPADVIPDWGTVLPAANVQAGADVANKCKSCHNLDNGGPNLTGPNLYGVEGRKPASHPGFAYSSAMMDFSGKNPAWTYDEIYQFLKAPGTFINGTKMTFVGLKKPEDRVNVIAYLRTLNASPPPIPAPNPKAAAAAAPAAAAGAPAVGAAPAAGAAAAGAATTGGAPSTGSNAAPGDAAAAAPPTGTKPTGAGAAK
ncbi:MAG TPA: cytochrome c family protein [Caulobacteraceae bacterium]|jgi:cytochrome c